ncbi:hypothetical protein [Actinomadura atramentaria]|uniref:hypothetical protein n=1 Tax=Actinomadura atramentaria TaxID=1990 RepID=UPI00146A1909|nr:hypothetical protein [Actinomadura atramentaria]
MLLAVAARSAGRRPRPPVGPPRAGLRLAHVFAHPNGTGFIGPDADGLLRAILVDALMSSARTHVVTTHSTVTRLLGGKPGNARELTVLDLLEDTVEYLESPAAMPSYGPSAILWVTTPDADTDVVYQTLLDRPRHGLIALCAGLWPHGPTYVIDQDDPFSGDRVDPPILTKEQALTALATG